MRDYLEKYTDEHSRFLVLDHALVHYRRQGSGPPLLLLHGIFSSLHTFDAWTEHLQRDFDVIRMDLPGFGLSDANADHRYDVAKYVQWLDQFLDRLDLEQVSLAGSSLGGWIAWEYALRFPERVNKLVLIDSAGYLDASQIPLPIRMARTPFMNRIVRYVIRRNLIEVFVRQVYGDPTKVTPELVDRYYELLARAGNPEAFFAFVNGKFKDNTPKLPRIETPTLILWGEKDAWLPVDDAYRFLHALPHAELIIYEGIGHVPMEEVPKQTAQDLREFLQSDEIPEAEEVHTRHL
ncbi:MAG: alpha/beta hydrolase [Bacteroidetes bacterium]|nr:MAG: alpha/beta hydrolase [Bacteroidota bacterium]